MAATTDLSALKRALASYDPAGQRAARGRIALGAPALDQALEGGLARGALHEIFSAQRAVDDTASAGFALALALCATRTGPFLWIRQDFVAAEAGCLYGAGLAAFGVDPARVILVSAANHADVLKAAGEALQCPALGAVLLEAWGTSRLFDLTASRRLVLAAEQTGAAVIALRLGASPSPSAAMSRWLVGTAPSRALEAHAPGRPAFSITLLRHRAGLPGQTWHVEWDRDECRFDHLPQPIQPAASRERPALSGAVVPLPARREITAPNRDDQRRRAG